jgi:hypothetical protein
VGGSQCCAEDKACGDVCCGPGQFCSDPRSSLCVSTTACPHGHPCLGRVQICCADREVCLFDLERNPYCLPPLPPVGP